MRASSAMNIDHELDNANEGVVDVRELGDGPMGGGGGGPASGLRRRSVSFRWSHVTVPIVVLPL